MALELILIGTSHLDFKGPFRLQKLLLHIQPQTIALEIDAARASETEAYHDFLKSAGGAERMFEEFRRMLPDSHPETLRRFMYGQGFEYTTSKAFAQSRGILLNLCDDLKGFFTEKIAKQMVDEVSAYIKMTPEAVQSSVDKQYALVEEVSEIELSILVPRDVFTERQLRTLSGRVLYVCGKNHIFGNYDNLYDRLKDINPQRMRLSDADALITIIHPTPQ